LLIECWIYENNAFLSELETGLMQGILANYMLNL